MGKIPISYPPDFRTEPEKFMDYINRMHHEVMGLNENTGNLDEDNGVTSYTTERTYDDVAAFIQNGEALIWTHDDSGNTLTGEVTKGAAVTDAVASGVSVDSADADAVYSANEQTLINELKADVNTLVTDVNNIKTVVNNIIASLETAKLMST